MKKLTIRNLINIIFMKIFLKIFFLIPVFSFSQKNYFNETPINISLDSINKQIIYQTNKSLFFIDSEKLNILNRKKILGSGTLNLHTIVKKNKILFLDKHGGDIFILNSKDSLKKDDKSHIKKFFLGNFHFIKNDTLFKHGGYGYWTQSNFITYYDELTKEWQIYSISETSEIPRSADAHIGISWENYYSFFGGNTLIENGSRIKNRRNKEVWSFNFNNKEWSLLGKYKESNLNLNSEIFSNEGDLYILDETKQLFKIDILNNNITKYKRTPILYDFYKVNPLYYNGYVYYVNNKGLVSKTLLSEITRDIENTDIFYSENHILQIILIILFISVTSSICLYFLTKYRGRNKLKFIKNKIHYKSKFIELDDLSISIIKIISKRETKLSEILELVSQSHLSKIQNERNRNLIISKINLKLKILTKNKSDFLLVSKSTFDKRYKIVSINNSAYGNFL